MSRAKSDRPRWLRPESALGAGLVAKAGALVLALAWALWLGLAPDPGAQTGPALAQAQEAPPDKPAEAPPAETAAEPAPAEPGAPVQFDPRLIQLIEQKRADLAAREAALAKEREQIEKLKADAMARIDELKKVQAALEELIKAEQDKREERIQQMVKLLANMRPDAAGAVVAKLDDQMAVDIFSRMQPRIAGKVMAALEPARAARIGEVLTHQRQAREAAAMAREAAANVRQPQARPAPAPP
ncbi:MAG: hypothetical protein LDL11_04150, partial [Desulfarculus sp.]|nr:hypothetical protein [Desulfarculus sp.]